ncbi:MAG TPA: hypothetical protein VLC09_16260, partial [Polyangiaceae bacterium]|nr:hypothetical protein [Polyangiaceae bacterium]
MPLWSRHEPDELRQEEDEARSERASALELSLQEWSTPRRARLLTHSRRHNLDIASGIIVASALAGLGMVVVDRLFRPEWDIAWGDHWLGAPILAISAAVLIGLAWTLLVLSERAVASAFPDSARRRDAVRVVCHSAMAGMLCWGTAVWTFSGKAVSQTLLGRLGPPVFALGVVGAVAACSWLGIRAARQVARRRYRGALQLGGAYFALAAAAFWADMNLYVSLYERLHTLLEVAAFALLVAACQIWGFAALRGFAWLRWPTRG